MKKGLTIIWCMVLAMACQAQHDFTAYEKLLAKGEYVNAWRWLEAKDPDNTDVAVYLKKANLAFDHSMGAMVEMTDDPKQFMFTLGNADTEGFMGSDETVSERLPIPADVAKFLASPSAPKGALYEVLGRFYYEMYLKLEDERLLPRAVENFRKVLELNHPSAWAHSIVGMDHSMKNQLKEAEKNYALAGDIATESNLGVKAYLAAANVALKQGNKALAAQYFIKSLRHKKQLKTYESIVVCGFEVDDSLLRAEYANQWMDWGKGNSDSYETLYLLYDDYEALPELLAVLLQKQTQLSGDWKALGVHYNCMAIIYTDLEKHAEALQYFEQAKAAALHYLPKDSESIKYLDSKIKETKSKL